MREEDSFQHWCETSLRTRLERVAAKRAPQLPAPQLLVVAPGVRFSFGAVEQPFHTASIGKVFVAALLGRLAGRGLLEPDSPVGELAPDLDLSGLPAADGVELSRDLTVAHLLSHRSGLPDPLLPPRGHETECSIRSLPAKLDRRWEPAQIVEQTVGLPPVGRPGERFHYGDANYALLLCVLEQLVGTPFSELLREHVFLPVGMRRTWQPHSTADDQELATLDIAPVHLGGRELSRCRALSGASADGGAVTTLDDLLRFQTALHEGELIDGALLARMARRRSRMLPGIHYGTGLATLRFSEFMPLLLRGLPEPVGGIGVWATHCFYYPRQRAHVIMNFHSDREIRRSFSAAHIPIARRLAGLAG